jgi:hypothetical protein
MPEEVNVSELNVDEVMELVGDDKELAASALAAEQASEHPRTTLVARLESVLAAEDEVEEAESEEPEEAPEAFDSDGTTDPGEPEAAPEPEEAAEEVSAAEFSPSVQDAVQTRMVEGQNLLKQNKDAQLRRLLGRD